MVGVLIGFGIVGFVVAAGYGVGRAGFAGPSAQFVLNRVAFFVFSPALLFVTLARSDVRTLFSSMLVVAVGSAVAAGGIFCLVSVIFLKRSAAETTIGILSSSYLNANNIGLPVAVYVLGSSSFVAPVLLAQLVLFAPVALTVLDITTSGRTSVRQIATLPLRNPIIIGSIAGIIVASSGGHLPTAILEPFTLIGGAAVPTVLIAFGMSLHGAKPLNVSDRRPDVIAAVIVKSAVMPLIAFAIARFGFGMGGHELFAVVTLAALPAAQNVFNYASRYETAVGVARDAVLLSSLVAIPAMVVISALLA